MFILSKILDNNNGIIKDGITRRIGERGKGKASTKENRGIGEQIRGNKEGNSCYRKLCRPGKSLRAICGKGRQCSVSNKELSRIRGIITLIPLFIFYNPYIFLVFMYIDMMFSDELIAFNMIQINSIIHNINELNTIWSNNQ